MVICWFTWGGAHVDLGNHGESTVAQWVKKTPMEHGPRSPVTMEWPCTGIDVDWEQLKLIWGSNYPFFCRNCMKLPQPIRWSFPLKHMKNTMFLLMFFIWCSFDCWQIIKLWKPRFWAMKSRYFFQFPGGIQIKTLLTTSMWVRWKTTGPGHQGIHVFHEPYNITNYI